MSANPASDMDIDSPVGPLKRCSSAPSINDTLAMSSSSVNQVSNNREVSPFSLYNNNQPRIRRFSASFMPGSPSSGLRLTPRISQIRQEEFADISNLRELAHEREVHHNMQISQSWEDFRLVTDAPKASKMGPLHVNLPCYHTNCNSPSPTRLISPGFQSPTRASRTFVRRSASPVLRPSPLGVKRKLDDDSNHSSPRAKRLHSFSDKSDLLAISSPLNSSDASSSDSQSFGFRMMDSSPSTPLSLPKTLLFTKVDQNITESPS